MDRGGARHRLPLTPISGAALSGVWNMASKPGGTSNAWHGHFEPKRVPEGVWMRCDGCQATLFRKQVDENQGVCPECNHHFPLPATDRIAQLFDPDTFEEWYSGLRPLDPLGFNDRRPY